MADREGKEVKVEIEVFSVSGWKENTGVETALGCVHGSGEHDEFSVYVSTRVLQTILETKGQGSNRTVLECLICATTVSRNFRSHLQRKH